MAQEVNVDAILKEMRETIANLIQENAILKAHINQLPAPTGDDTKTAKS